MGEQSILCPLTAPAPGSCLTGSSRLSPKECLASWSYRWAHSTGLFSHWSGGLIWLAHGQGDREVFLSPCQDPLGEQGVTQWRWGSHQGDLSPFGSSCLFIWKESEGKILVTLKWTQVSPPHPHPHPRFSARPRAGPWLLLQVSERTLFKHTYSGP